MNENGPNKTVGSPASGKGATRPTEAPKTLDEWTGWLREKEMPIFSHTAKRLSQAMEDQRSGITELSRIILEDPSLTTKLLKLSNSPYYNPSRQHLGTITRAIVLVGLEPIRELALACSFIEAILSQNNKQQVNREIARALHAAVQAKSFAVLASEPLPEEVFIAALLHNIGHIAFWCFEQELGDEITRLVRAEHLDPEQAERQVLGFKLGQLGAALSKTWRLGGLIEESFATAGSSRRKEIVRVGCEIARLCEDGWETAEIKRRLAKVAQLTGKTPQDIQAQVKANAENAVKLATHFGAREASTYIPTATEVLPPSDGCDSPAETGEKSETTLLQIMQDITNILNGEINLKLLFEIVIEGIYRGLAMDRVLFAILTPDRKMLREKFSLGWPAVETRGLAQIPIDGTPPNLFSFALDRNEHLWAKKDGGSPLGELFTPSIQARIGRHECCISPISLNKKTIGLFYADRAMSHKPMTQEVFDGFKQLTSQANIALKLSQRL
jgi:HD-like signal output (HDOD) protein